MLNNTDYEMMAAAVAGRDSSLSGESITDPEGIKIFKEINKSFSNYFIFKFLFIDSYRSDNRNKKIKKKKPVDHYDDKLSVRIQFCFTV